MKETVPDALAGERLDRALSLLTGLTRSEAVHLIDAGRVRLDGVTATVRSRRLAVGEVIEAEVEVAAAPAGPRADPSIEVPVVHADRELIVVDKPAGMVVHPGAGRADGTMVNGLLARFPELAGVGEPHRPGVVHRLDAGTSGLLAVARTGWAYESLVRQLGSRTVSRVYDALVWGVPSGAAGMVDAPVGRSGRDPTRMTVSATGREARTRYRVIEAFSAPAEVSLVACELETGRTHQIRVHLAAIGHPVVGDRRYGGARSGVAASRPLLHARRLELDHPATGERLVFEAPLPDDFSAVLASLGSTPRN